MIDFIHKRLEELTPDKIIDLDDGGTLKVYSTAEGESIIINTKIVESNDFKGVLSEIGYDHLFIEGITRFIVLNDIIIYNRDKIFEAINMILNMY